MDYRYLLLLIFLVAVWVFTRKNGNFKQFEKDRFSSLLCACFGNREQCERLISYEISRDKRISRRVAIDRAIDRLTFDRSR